jgi:2-hydroxy-6-oxonona-2,4-dienedioate hydrolase
MTFLQSLGVAAALAAVAVWLLFRADMRTNAERITGHSLVIPSPYGSVEYAHGGRGPDVLVVHGSGGGFDQGALIAETFLGDGFHWIAPSRFGYLRSDVPDGATFDEQAHAYAALLDHLGLERVAVVAFSHGGPSALLFAALHPERVSSLTLVSCGAAPLAVHDQAAADRKGAVLTAIYRHDWLYWTATRLLRRPFMRLMGASGDVIADLSPQQRTIIDRVIDEMNPVSARQRGVAFDNGAALPGERIAAIEAPTLIIHAADDLLQLFENAAFAAATIPGARLMRFEHGGHLLMAVEQDAIREALQHHVRQHASGEVLAP